MKKTYYLFLFLTIGICHSMMAQTLLSAKGTNLLMPYSKMALNAKLIGPAIEDND